MGIVSILMRDLVGLVGILTCVSSGLLFDGAYGVS